MIDCHTHRACAANRGGEHSAVAINPPIKEPNFQAKGNGTQEINSIASTREGESARYC
jgi:hypothetical protein